MAYSNYNVKYSQYNAENLHLDRLPDTYSRNYIAGKNNLKRLAPYISGYWYLCLIPPKELVGDNLVNLYTKVFNAAAESFAPPSRSISKQDVVGFGGIKKFVATSQEYSNSFSITFREHSNLEIFNILSHWAGMINPFIGNHTKVYKGQCIIILAKPTFSKVILNNNGTPSNKVGLTKDDIEEVFYFDGVFPESQGIDAIESNIESFETKQLNITFNFDGGFMSKFKYSDEIYSEKFLEEFNTYIGDNILHEASTNGPIKQTI